jgi:Rps23 Pro-64 3,4-dihydroxylase Tpa1-like proline 4-hydroxylase
MIQKELDALPWWMYAIQPNQNVWIPKYYSLQDPQLSTCFEECKHHLVNNKFCYRIKRTINDHYDICNCIGCRLEHTARSDEVTTFISTIVGKPVYAKEVFVSCYSKDDFISIHHDTKKGDLAVTFSLSDWSPVYGGILHFCEKDVITKSISPVAGNAIIFFLDPENGFNHFVSPVCVDKNRYTLTAWYSFL